MNNKKSAKHQFLRTAVIFSLLAFTRAAMSQSSGFRWFGPLTRILTPNGDGNNDVAFICFDNPSDSDVSGKIYSLLGSEIASFGPRQMTVSHVPQCPDGATASPGQYLTWDGRTNGTYVHSGIYLYRISAEGKVYSGTLVVVR